MALGSYTGKGARPVRNAPTRVLLHAIAILLAAAYLVPLAVVLLNSVRSAEENYSIQSEEYTRSLVSNLDVLTALESLQQTRQSENLTYYVMKQDEAAFRVAIGEVS